mmetsp:Transcript_11667/g.45407  ORF Transcript_11667/g.45407 Transcript_11667/m.45407 type:complete len:212 (+) Transcript_11667:471-1106(+)
MALARGNRPARPPIECAQSPDWCSGPESASMASLYGPWRGAGGLEWCMPLMAVLYPPVMAGWLRWMPGANIEAGTSPGSEVRWPCSMCERESAHASMAGAERAGTKGSPRLTAAAVLTAASEAAAAPAASAAAAPVAAEPAAPPLPTTRRGLAGALPCSPSADCCPGRRVLSSDWLTCLGTTSVPAGSTDPVGTIPTQKVKVRLRRSDRPS